MTFTVIAIPFFLRLTIHTKIEKFVYKLFGAIKLIETTLT